jgi:hypothetical protein
MGTLGSDSHGLRTRASQQETSPFPLEFMVVSRRTRDGQEETSPFPLEFEVVARKARVNQEETAPFPLEFEVVSRKGKVSQEETSPIPLEFMIVLPDGEVALARAARVQRGRGRTPPGLKWRGINASIELREYAARVAAGEDLPPYRGPILANGESPGFAAQARRIGRATPAPLPVRAGQMPAVLKLALGMVLMVAAVVASARLGDDADLRAAGQSISRWFSGLDSAF